TWRPSGHVGTVDASDKWARLCKQLPLCTTLSRAVAVQCPGNWQIAIVWYLHGGTKQCPPPRQTHKWDNLLVEFNCRIALNALSHLLGRPLRSVDIQLDLFWRLFSLG